MGCVYVANSVWQGVVGGWCSTAIIWAQGVESDGRGVGRRREGGREARWRFHLNISQILPICMCATAMTTFLEMVNELICLCAYVFLFIMPV